MHLRLLKNGPHFSWTPLSCGQCDEIAVKTGHHPRDALKVMNLYVSVCWYLCWVVIMCPTGKQGYFNWKTSPKKSKQFSSQFMICDRIMRANKGKRAKITVQIILLHVLVSPLSAHRDFLNGDMWERRRPTLACAAYMSNHEHDAWTKHQSSQVEATKSRHFVGLRHFAHFKLLRWTSDECSHWCTQFFIHHPCVDSFAALSL